MAKPTEQEIRQRAHQLWEQSDRPDGRDEEFWHEAERDLSEDRLDEPMPKVMPG